MLIEIILILLIILLPIIAQAKVKLSYKRYSKINNSKNLSGKEVERMILDRNGLNNVTVGKISGTLTDHYTPSRKNIDLSEEIYSGKSIAAVAVAAHECGHAIQDKEAYSFLKFRTNLVPLVNITSYISPILIAIGFGSQIAGIATLGIAFLFVALLFQLVTLPVEFNASTRGKKQLEELGLIEKSDKKGAKSVLKAAALTYVAGFLSTAFQIARFLIMSGIRKRD